MIEIFAGEIVGLDAVAIREAGERFVGTFVARMRYGT
jgi:hypothetical protein